jgi:hypothetical protein
MAAGSEAQTEQGLRHLAAVLREAGTSLDHVAKATVFVTDLDDFGKLNAIYTKRFGAHKPARSTVQVAALPRGASVEIQLAAQTAPRLARPPPLALTNGRFRMIPRFHFASAWVCFPPSTTGSLTTSWPARNDQHAA